MDDLFDHQSGSQRIYVVSGNIDEQTFEATMREESFSIYSDHVPRTGEFIGGHFGDGHIPGHFLKKVNGVLYTPNGDIYIYIDKTIYQDEDSIAEVSENTDLTTKYINEMLERHKNGSY